ncbi:response regulator transcription factor [Alteromonas australica]|jgi:DNA-binding response OmpR family regulator|uniref:XRE family transcriptional regulator n=1 Tax=Alteromonas australica TaxID=589873 RepID=A0A075NYR8_9ALTE|nr:response regulator transcription factor [Alteromonas australica]AIF97740.1 XRE family transcriptional regulator [Alteromonas australica]HBF73587.1 DNA-binding response regulator [Alteromonas australica]|tara:strand:+ start:3399 stop:4079 length:681 start_codon:yes stop_codon:yes gene_type:complete
MIRVLLVEDDLGLAGNILDYLELEDMVCDHAANGMAALHFQQTHRYQVIILDINLPQMNGLSVCEHIRNEGDDTPIIMLTARDKLEDKLVGFEKGADDYLIKPFAMAELVARVSALANRRSSQVNQLTFGNVILTVNPEVAMANGEAIKLSPTTYRLLKHLVRAGGECVSRATLVEAVWGEDAPESNALKVHIHHLRKALTQANANVQLLSRPNSGFYLSTEPAHG